MGQLTNQFVSQSYQGLLNLANANTGFTANLQTITDGLGGSSPLQISQTQVNISGTFTVNGAPVSVDTGSLVTTSSFNAFTSSVDLRFDGIELETGSLQNQINQKLDTGSFNAYTSSNDSKVNSLIAGTGSYATTSSLTALSQSIASTDLAQDNRLTAIESITGSLATTGSLNSYTLTSSFNSYTSSNDSKVNSLISQTGSYVTETESGSFVTNVFQNPFLFNQIAVTKGNGSTTTLTVNNVQSASFANNATSSSFAQNALSASYAPDISNRNGLITTGSIGGSQSITGSLNVEGTISATSASFTYVNTIYETASVIYSSGSNQLGDASDDTQTLWGTVNLPTGPLVITGSVTSTGGFTGSLFGTASNAISSSHAINADTASYFNGLITSASYAVTSSISFDLVVYGKCDNPGGLTRGTVVRITGAVGDNPLFNSASWEDDFNSANTLGMLSEDVIYNDFANVVVQGTLIGINTSGMTAGDMLYLSSSGQYTNVIPPAPYHEVRLGQVLRPQLNNGSAYISIDNGYELSELHDVDITSPVVGDLLVYRSGSYGQWVNETGGEIGFATTGSNIFIGNQTLTGSFNQTGSMSVIGNSGNPSAIIARFGDPSYGIVEISGNGQLSATNVIKATSIQNWNTVGSSPIDVLNTLGDIYLTPKTATGSVILGQNQSHKAVVTGSVDVRNGDLKLNSNNTTVNTNLYLTSSQAGQTNIIKGWGDNPTAGGAQSVQANYTGSLRITGSNNIVSMPQIRATGVGGGVDQQGYISGSDNTLTSNGGGMYLNTGSLLFPKTTNNYVGATSNILMNFTTSSIAGGHPIFNNNTLYAGQLTINSNSGSINVIGNLINGGQIASNQNFVTNNRAIISANYINQATTLNHISSSIIYNNNLVNSTITVNNHLSSSALVAGNTVTMQNNAVFGGSSNTGLGIWVSGSQSSQNSRNIVDNLIGGKNIIISSSFVSSSNSSLSATVVYGQGLTVNGNVGTGTAAGGGAFLGRYNDTGSLSLTNDIVFAVGTGTSAANRRTGLYVTSGSLVGISGSMDIKGITNALVITGSQTIQHVTAGQPALTLIAQGSGQPALTITGSLNVSGSGDHYIYGNTLRITGQTQMSGNSDFPLYVSGTIQSQRLHFDGNPFNTLPAYTLGAIRMAADNETLQYTNYNKAEITSQSFIDQYVNTGSLTTQTKFGATYGGTTARVDVINNNGTRRVDILSDSISVTGSMNISSVMNMRPLDPLPAGNIGDLAVSSSNQLYFYNGAWTLVV